MCVARCCQLTHTECPGSWSGLDCYPPLLTPPCWQYQHQRHRRTRETRWWKHWLFIRILFDDVQRARERKSRRFKSFTLLLKWCCYFQSIDGGTCCLNVCWTEWTFSRVCLKYHIPINTHIYTWTNVCSLSVEDVMKKVVFKEIVSQSIVLSFYWKYCKFKVFDFPQN